MDRMLKIKGGFLAGKEPTLADIYAFSFMCMTQPVGLGSFEEFEHIQEWWIQMQKVDVRIIIRSLQRCSSLQCACSLS